MDTEITAKTSETEPADKPGQPMDKTQIDAKEKPLVPYVTLWQDETGVIQVKLGNNLTPVNAIALLEMGLFRYKTMLLPAVSPRSVNAPKNSEPQNA